MSIASEIDRIQNAKTSIKTAIENKGVEVGDGTIDTYASKIDEISTGGNDDVLASILSRTITEINANDFPESVTYIGNNAFYGCAKLTKVILPPQLIGFGHSAFLDCKLLTEVHLNGGLESIGHSSFSSCTALTELIIPNTVYSIGAWAFRGCYKLKTLFIPNSVLIVDAGGGLNSFEACSSLEFVTLEDGFNCNSLKLYSSTKFSRETIVSWFNALADRTGKSAYTLTIGSTNLAKVTEEEIAIATAKNWTIA
jgi:hypothetical protein